MVKYSFNFLILFILFTSLAYAKNLDANLQNEYGQDLTKAPFIVRYSFAEQYQKNWVYSTYNERKAYLTNYDNALAADRAQAKADAKAEAQKKKERLDKKRAEERKQRDRAKAEADEEKSEKQANAARQRALDDQVRDQSREIQQMTQQYTQSGK